MTIPTVVTTETAAQSEETTLTSASPQPALRGGAQPEIRLRQLAVLRRSWPPFAQLAPAAVSALWNVGLAARCDLLLGQRDEQRRLGDRRVVVERSTRRTPATSGRLSDSFFT